MLKRNTKIPSQLTTMSASEVMEYSSMNLHVYEGERLLAIENRLLGRLQVDTRKGEESMFKIHFEVDTDGILTASIQDHLTNNKTIKEIERSTTSLSKKEVERLRQEALAYKRDDEKEIERLSQRNKLLALCTNIRYHMRTKETLLNLSERQRAKIEQKCQDAVDWTNSNLEATRGQFQAKAEELLVHWERDSPALAGMIILLPFPSQL